MSTSQKIEFRTVKFGINPEVPIPYIDDGESFSIFSAVSYVANLFFSTYEYFTAKPLYPIEGNQLVIKGEKKVIPKKNMGLVKRLNTQDLISSALISEIPTNEDGKFVYKGINPFPSISDLKSLINDNTINQIFLPLVFNTWVRHICVILIDKQKKEIVFFDPKAYRLIQYINNLALSAISDSTDTIKVSEVWRRIMHCLPKESVWTYLENKSFLQKDFVNCSIYLSSFVNDGDVPNNPLEKRKEFIEKLVENFDENENEEKEKLGFYEILESVDENGNEADKDGFTIM